LKLSMALRTAYRLWACALAHRDIDPYSCNVVYTKTVSRHCEQKGVKPALDSFEGYH
jgi:predicted N-formylglutamate amidohydrolase